MGSLENILKNYGITGEQVKDIQTQTGLDVESLLKTIKNAEILKRKQKIEKIIKNIK